MSQEVAASQDAEMRALMDRWRRVWNEGRIELVADCVAPVYTRHEPAGTRRVTPEQYAQEIATRRGEAPDLRFAVYDHAFVGDRVWLRWSRQWTDPTTGQRTTRAGLQVYRVEDGKLAETWWAWHELGSAWPDPAEHDRWSGDRHA